MQAASLPNDARNLPRWAAWWALAVLTSACVWQPQDRYKCNADVDCVTLPGGRCNQDTHICDSTAGNSGASSSSSSSSSSSGASSSTASSTSSSASSSSASSSSSAASSSSSAASSSSASSSSSSSGSTATYHADMDFNGDGIMDVLIRTQNADGGFMMAYKAGPMRSVSGTCAPTTLIPLSANGKGIPVPLARSSGGHEVWMYEGDTFSGPDGGQAAIAAGLPVTGQFNGLTEDGILAVFTNGTWQGSGLPVSFSSLFGQAGDIPVPGDYLGLGYDQRAVVRNEAGQLYWYWEHPDGGLGGGPFGVAGDVPIPADYNRDGVLDVAVYRYDGRVVFIALPDASTLELPQGASGAPSNVFPCALTASEMGYCTWRFDDISTVSFDLHTVAAGFAETCSATMPGFVAVIGSHQWAIP